MNHARCSKLSDMLKSPKKAKEKPEDIPPAHYKVFYSPQDKHWTLTSAQNNQIIISGNLTSIRQYLDDQNIYNSTQLPSNYCLVKTNIQHICKIFTSAFGSNKWAD